MTNKDKYYNINKQQELIMLILDRIDELWERKHVLESLLEDINKDIGVLEEMKDKIREKYPTKGIKTVKSYKLVEND